MKEEKSFEIKCPCDGCILFALCKNKDIEADWFATTLRYECSLLKTYLEDGHNSGKYEEYVRKVNETRKVFGIYHE